MECELQKVNVDKNQFAAKMICNGERFGNFSDFEFSPTNVIGIGRKCEGF